MGGSDSGTCGCGVDDGVLPHPKSREIHFTISFVFLQDSAEDKIPMCVIGNKVDLRDQHPEGTCVSSLHGEKLAKVSNFSLQMG